MLAGLVGLIWDNDATSGAIRLSAGKAATPADLGL
jgi:hypothetical protein